MDGDGDCNMKEVTRLAVPFTDWLWFDQPCLRKAGLLAALRQNAPKRPTPKFPSGRHAGNEIDRRALGCRLYFGSRGFA
jgi:hypothetical protein